MFSALICSIYSGTVAGAREAFLYGIPAIAMSYDWYGNTLFSLILSAVLNHILSHSAAIGDPKNMMYVCIKCYRAVHFMWMICW